MKDTIGSRIKLEIKYDDCVSEWMAGDINKQIIEIFQKSLKDADINMPYIDITMKVLETEYIDESEEW